VTKLEFLHLYKDVEARAKTLVMGISSSKSYEEARNALLSRSNGSVVSLLKKVPELPVEDRPDAGKNANALKEQVEQWLLERLGGIQAQEKTGPTVDLTMPPRTTWRGGRHPVTLVIDEITSIFRELGFTVALGPEAETNWYNFGALNFPADHPAMDLHDTLYLSDDVVLRTHTSPVQIRTLQSSPPPIRIIAPGNAYRRDFFDASHAPMFTQIEGLAVDEGVSFVDLKATLTHFARRLFGTTVTRFRPSYFPFTEPSAEMDVECQICHGAGCATCKQTGWVEILGSGMVHPAVLEAAGVDSERYTGWAFGMGPARIATQRYGIPDIRELYDTDVRVLERLAR
jgi:phenylalanyl-tRNA synthetase alpha chain